MVKNFFLLSVLTVFFLFQFKAVNMHTQSFGFGDEAEHVVMGWDLVKANHVLYQDVFSNHQPIPIFLSAVLFKIIDIPNLFMAIENARRLVFVISFAGALILTLRFKFSGLLASILVEIIKFYFFGTHLLAESLIIYPAMFVGALVIEKKAKNSFFDDLLFGLSIFWMTFTLLPTIIYGAITTLLYLLQRKQKSVITVCLAIILPSLILFSQFSPLEWFQTTILGNSQYIQDEIKWQSPQLILSIIFHPFIAASYPNIAVGRFYLFLLSLFFIGCIRQKNFLLPIIAYILLAVINTRMAVGNQQFYFAFHALPQVAVMTILAIMIYFKKPLRVKYLFLGAIIITISFISSFSWWQDKIDKNTDHTVQYDKTETAGRIINYIKSDGDGLIAGPMEGYVNLITDLPLYSQASYLSWSYKIPLLRDRFLIKFAQKPPTYIYFPNIISKNLYLEYLKPYIKRDYFQVYKEGKPTDLYISTQKDAEKLKELGLVLK